MKKGIVRFLAIACVAMLVSACSKDDNFVDNSEPLKLSDTDYANTNNWFRFSNNPNKAVDIFLIYPTLPSGDDPADRPFVTLESPGIKESAENWYSKIGLAVEPNGNVFAPYYRQVSFQVLPTLDASMFPVYADSIPRQDIFAAFDYFVKYVNKGERPFILLGHSQGSHMARELTTTFLGHEEYKQYNQKHIATYAIGINVTAAHIAKNASLKFSETPTDTHVIMSWNSISESEAASKVYLNFGTYEAGSIVTNPITWTRSEAPAPKEDNKESIVSLNGTVAFVDKYVGATVDQTNGILIITGIDEASYTSPMPVLGKFHMYDSDFFFGSIKQNIADRIKAYTGI